MHTWECWLQNWAILTLQFGKSESWQTGKLNLGQCRLHNLAKVKLAKLGNNNVDCGIWQFDKVWSWQTSERNLTKYPSISYFISVTSVKHRLDFSFVFSATLGTCPKKPVLSKQDLLQWKVPASLSLPIAKKWKNPSCALRSKRTWEQQDLPWYSREGWGHRSQITEGHVLMLVSYT